MAGLLDADPDANHAGADRHFDVAQAPLGGCFTRCCPRLLRSVDRAWKMYFVGFVFGLGFDTASEIALLSISVITSQQQGSPGFAVLLAFLFTCRNDARRHHRRHSGALGVQRASTTSANCSTTSASPQWRR
jgi:hypothetical protein